MIGFAISATVVAVERFINRRRLKIHEILRDTGWLTLILVGIEFGYLYVVEALTKNYGVAIWLLWLTEWPVFKFLLIDAAVGVMLVLMSVWLEQAGITELRITTRRLHLLSPPSSPSPTPAATAAADKCDVEW